MTLLTSVSYYSYDKKQTSEPSPRPELLTAGRVPPQSPWSGMVVRSRPAGQQDPGVALKPRRNLWDLPKKFCSRSPNPLSRSLLAWQPEARLSQHFCLTSFVLLTTETQLRKGWGYKQCWHVLGNNERFLNNAAPEKGHGGLTASPHRRLPGPEH